MNKVYIAGSGSGDIGNLTLKVKNIIEKSDVILYDNLVSDEIINLAKNDAILIDVGKIAGFHKVKQENTNKLLVDYAKKYKTVLRLKGGDPYVFGRGAEEAQELIENGIDFEICSAVTSVVSVPASVGIPVTHRDYASSFFVITARKKKDIGLDEEDFRQFAILDNTTLIFMMSTSSAKKIAQGLINAGKSVDTRSMIISNGTKANVKKYKHTLGTLSQISDETKFDTPGMLVVGDVLSLSDVLDISNKKPLSQKRIIINVARQKDNTLEQKLYELGADIVNLSTNYLIKKYDKKEFVNIFENICRYNIICFSSSYGVDSFFDILIENGIDIRRLSHIKYGVVGYATAEALKKHSIIADYIPEVYSGSALADLLIKKNEDEILCILSHDTKSDLYDSLSEIKNVKRLNIYKQVIGKVRVYNEQDDDIFVFTSSNAVLGVAESYENGHFVGKRAYCIGCSTEKTAKKYGFYTVMANQATVESLVDCILNKM